MATSSISIDVRAANSKLADFLRAKEEEEALLQIGSVRIRKDKPSDADGGGSGKMPKRPREAWQRLQRWNAKIDFRKASPMTDRPRNEAGASSFHFAVSTISKQGAPTWNGKPMSGFTRRSSTPGADHELYVSREGAAEVQAAVHAAYVERDSAPEVDLAAFDKTARVSIDEGLSGARVAADASGRPSIFSNISDDPFEREAYWRAVDACERSPRVHTILIDVARDIDWASRAVTNADFPGSFRAELEFGLADYKAWLLSDRSKELRPRAWTGDSDACGKVLMAARSNPASGSGSKALQFQSGRGGIVQHRFVIELPHELTAAERANLTQRFCEHLGSLEKAQDGTVRGMMYTAVIHAPDAHNDARNFHLHIIAHDRPARFLDQYGQWDFEVEEAYVHNRMIRVRRPFQQDKIRAVNGTAKGDDPSSSGKNFIPTLRRKFAELANETLAAAGLEKRYDPRSYKAMGIDRTPTEHLGTKAAAMEAAGVETTIGSLNAAIIWSDAQRQVLKQSASRKKAEETRHKVLRTFLQEAREQIGTISPVIALTDAIAERDRIAIDTIEDRELIDSFRLMEAKAKSRALKVRDTCVQTMADIDRGLAPEREARQRAKISERYREANAWLGKIDAALEPDRARIEAAERDVQRREERMVELDATITLLTRQLQPMMRSQAQAKEKPQDRTAGPQERRAGQSANRPGRTAQQASETPAAAPDRGRGKPQPERTESRPTQTTAKDTKPSRTQVGDVPTTSEATRAKAPVDQEPPLFDMPVQKVPPKPGTAADRDAQWEAIFARISEQKVPIIKRANEDHFELLGMRDAEAALLRDPVLERRSQARLAAIEKNQALSVGRVAAWLEKNGTDPACVRPEGDSLVLVDAPQSVKNLHRQWSHHPALQEAMASAARKHRDVDHLVEWFRTEGQRTDKLWFEGNRMEFAQENDRERMLFVELRTDPRVRQAAQEELDRRDAAELAAASKQQQAAPQHRRPTPIFDITALSGWEPIPASAVRSPTLRDFVMELNGGAVPENLYAWALEVQRSRDAMAEIHLHGEQLALAYRRAIESPGPVPPHGRDIVR